MLLVGLRSTGFLSSFIIGFLLEVLLRDKNSTDEIREIMQARANPGESRFRLSVGLHLFTLPSAFSIEPEVFAGI
jgi:hypothetical protein